MKRIAQLTPIALLVAGIWMLWVRFSPTGKDKLASFLFNSDFANYYIPMTRNAAERLASGELPLWNPDACSGMPFLATLQSGVLYPGTWLALLLPAAQALEVLLLAECLIGGFFAMLLFRAWGCDLFAAAAGGLIFVFTCCIGQTMWPPAIATLCWLPCLALCIGRFADGGESRWWAGVALTFGLQILAGQPQFLVYGLMFLAPFAALKLATLLQHGGLPFRAVVQRAGLLGLAIAIGAGLASVQLLPTLELVANTLRSASLSPDEIHYLNTLDNPLHSSLQVLAAAFNSTPEGIPFGYPGVGYHGTATLLLIAAAIVAGRRQALTWLLVGLAGLALLLSDGFRGAWPELYELYAGLPVLGSMRTPERHRVIAFFCVAGLAALGFAALVQNGRDPRERRLLAAAVVIAAVGAAIGAAVIWKTPVWHLATFGRAGLALLLTLAILWSRRSGVRQTLAALLLLFIATDLAAATPPTAQLRQLSEIRLNRFVGIRPAQLNLHRSSVGGDRLELSGFSPHIGSGPTGGVRRLSCYEPLVPEAWSALHRRIVGSPSIGKTLFDVRHDEFPALFDVASVRRILIFGGRRRLDDAFDVVKNGDALPRAYFLTDYRVATRDEAHDAIATGAVDFNRTVLLDRDPGLSRRESPPGAAAVARSARLIRDLPEVVEIDVEAPASGLLVLTDTHFPGWQATVDGRAAEILLANGLYRAVGLDPGRHRVVFRYQPQSLRRGAALSGVSIVIVAVVGLRRRRASS